MTITIINGAQQSDFEVVSVTPVPESEKMSFNDINWNRRVIVRATWLAWEIVFGKLTEAEMDFLIALDKAETPQVVMNSTTYDVEVDSMRIRAVGATLTLINKAPE